MAKVDECSTFQAIKTDNDVDLTINIQKVKPKLLEVAVQTLPCNNPATISLVESETSNTIIFGVPKGCDGEDAKDGKDGQDAVVDYGALQTYIIEHIPAPIPGQKGEKGDDGNDGQDGQDGQDAVVDYGALQTYIIEHIPAPIPGQKGEKGDKGNDGNDGQDGQDGQDAVVDYGALQTYIIEHIPAPIPGQNGQKGEKGDKGDDGNDGQDGQDGQDAVVDYDALQTYIIEHIPAPIPVDYELINENLVEVVNQYFTNNPLEVDCGSILQCIPCDPCIGGGSGGSGGVIVPPTPVQITLKIKKKLLEYYIIGESTGGVTPGWVNTQIHRTIWDEISEAIESLFSPCPVPETGEHPLCPAQVTSTGQPIPGAYSPFDVRFILNTVIKKIGTPSLIPDPVSPNCYIVDPTWCETTWLSNFNTNLSNTVKNLSGLQGFRTLSQLFSSDKNKDGRNDFVAFYYPNHPDCTI